MFVVFDFRGLNCPEPVVRSRVILGGPTPPRDADILVDNQASLQNVSRFWQKAGYIVTHEKEDKHWRINARLKEGTTVDLQQAEGAELVACDANAPKTVVLITTETLGRGDDELGAKLMVNFLGSLPELGLALWRVILLNGGVKLAANEGPALENLKKLEVNGITILVCGTCLNHYNLLEKKQVGETTNMLDIVTALSLADKVIRP